MLQPLGHSVNKHRCSICADDVILFAAPTTHEFRVTIQILQLFNTASDLQTNMEKCSITPMFGSNEILPQLQIIMPCQITRFSIKLLGLPLSTTKISKAHLQPIVDKVAAKLPLWQGPLMPRSSRFILIKAVLITMPIYIIMAEKMPLWMLEELNSICRNFLWVGGEQSSEGQCMVNCTTVCTPYEYGGLGVMDFKLAGYYALLLRWLWLQKMADKL